MAEPIPMVLHCPLCNCQHVDAPEPERGWTNPPHKSHLCAFCRTIWRPADVETVGVESIATRGSHDTWPRIGRDSQPLKRVVAQTLAELISVKQLLAIRKVAHAKGIDAEAESLRLYDAKPEELTRWAAHDLLLHLKTAEGREEATSHA